MLHHGDCLDVMAAMEPESVDAIVTDPPYGISFMAKDWDAPGAIGDFPMRRSKATNTVNTGVSRQGGRQQQGLDFQKRQARDARSYQESSAAWAREAYRVAKPSAYLLAFGGTRTVHRMVAGIEDAGWIIRDMLVWGYASGFPKSKASLKPAWEPIVMARKPGPLRMLNIDECRIPLSRDEAVDGRIGELTADTRYGDKVRATPGRRIRVGGGAAGSSGFAQGYERGDGFVENTSGRWPANIVLTDPIFDGGWEGVVGGGEASTGGSILGDKEYADIGYHGNLVNRSRFETYGDSGTYSRFFIIPKADRADREPVLGGGGPGGRVVSVWGGDEDDLTPGKKSTRPRHNHHPTVKPTDLMRHLVRLVTPAGGTVLDPFLGSGTTALAAEMEGFDWIGIEREAEYVAIAEARLNGTQRGLGLETA